MAIDFSCPRCGMRFSLDDSKAGKKGKCKKCKHPMLVPELAETTESVVATGRFRLGDVTAELKRASSPPPVEARAGAKGPTSPESINLVAITEDNLSPAQLQRDPFEDSFEESVYDIAHKKALKKHQNWHDPADLPAVPKKRGKKPVNTFQLYYKRFVRYLIRFIEWFSSFAYLIIAPFVVVMLFGTITQRRDIAVLGAAGVILPYLGQLILYGIRLGIMPFKDGPVQGVLFFIPPFTFYYLWKHWKRMKKATKEFLTPALPILCVVLLFTFIPWLSKGKAGDDASILERIKAEAKVLREEIPDEAQQAGRKASKALDSGGLQLDQAIDSLHDQVKSLERNLDKKLSEPGGFKDQVKDLSDSASKKLQEVKESVQETIDSTLSEPDSDTSETDSEQNN